ncbi:macrosialin-like [Hypomesus transpacificus]|uniref:macrosialin-like n=1 Tax=Hypomesus transpacificus TaxID=137520 RepID=UPI001F078C49|nr:macrosialin-like [Hypomesus transpacificus]XP_046904845.1 macrosialin-like [Hypomesus transpacificus]
MKGFLLLCTLAFVSGLLPEGSTVSVPSGSLSPAFGFDTKPTPSNTTTPKPTTPSTTPSNTTTPKPTTPSTTPSNTTTLKPTTPSTTPSNTTTLKPTTKPTTTPKPTTPSTTPSNTTTPKPTTPSTTPSNTTTPKPTTPSTTTLKTTTLPPTTEPKPTKHANLTVGSYTVPEGKGLCLRAQMALELRLVTDKANGTFIVQPSMTKATGQCETSTAELTLTFTEGFITLLFNKSAADKMVYVDAISFKLSYPFTSGGNQEFQQQNKSLHLFAAATGYSYSCKSDSLYMGNGLYLDVTQDQMQAFNLVNNQDFGKPQPCPADKPDYRVAIAVGVVLLVLIVIVLIAYLLGRRKRTSGYQSL